MNEPENRTTNYAIGKKREPLVRIEKLNLPPKQTGRAARLEEEKKAQSNQVNAGGIIRTEHSYGPGIHLRSPSDQETYSSSPHSVLPDRLGPRTRNDRRTNQIPPSYSKQPEQGDSELRRGGREKGRERERGEGDERTLVVTSAAQPRRPWRAPPSTRRARPPPAAPAPPRRRRSTRTAPSPPRRLCLLSCCSDPPPPPPVACFEFDSIVSSPSTTSSSCTFDSALPRRRRSRIGRISTNLFSSCRRWGVGVGAGDSRSFRGAHLPAAPCGG